MPNFPFPVQFYWITGFYSKYFVQDCRYYMVGHCKCFWFNPHKFIVFPGDKLCSIFIVKLYLWTQYLFQKYQTNHKFHLLFLPSTLDQSNIWVTYTIIYGSISDRNSSAELTDKIVIGLSVIDKLYFTGTRQFWILQHLLITRVQWLLLIYKTPISLTFKLEQQVSIFIRKLLHLYHSTSSLCFYSSVSSCPFPIKSLPSSLKA